MCNHFGFRGGSGGFWWGSGELRGVMGDYREVPGDLGDSGGVPGVFRVGSGFYRHPSYLHEDGNTNL